MKTCRHTSTDSTGTDQKEERLNVPPAKMQKKIQKNASLRIYQWGDDKPKFTIDEDYMAASQVQPPLLARPS